MSRGLVRTVYHSAAAVTAEYERLVGRGADQAHDDAHAAFLLASELSTFLHAVDALLLSEDIAESTRVEVRDSSAHAVLIQLVDERARAQAFAEQPHLLLHDAYFQDLQRYHLGTVYGCMLKVWDIVHPDRDMGA